MVPGSYNAGMNKTYEQLKKELSTLSAKEKAALARSLIEDLDDASDDDVEEAWAEEAERRYEAFVDRLVEVVPADDVIARAKQRFK